MIKATEIVSIYPTWDEAVAAAYAKYGLSGFCIIQINTIEFYTRTPGIAAPDLQQQAA